MLLIFSNKIESSEVCIFLFHPNRSKFDMTNYQVHKEHIPDNITILAQDKPNIEIPLAQ